MKSVFHDLELIWSLFLLRKYIISCKQTEVPLSVPWDPSNQVTFSATENTFLFNIFTIKRSKLEAQIEQKKKNSYISIDIPNKVNKNGQEWQNSVNMSRLVYFIIKYGIVLNFVNLLWLKHLSTFIQGFLYSQCLQCVSPLPCISTVLLYGQHC